MNMIAILALIMLFIQGFILGVGDKYNKVKIFLFVFGIPIMIIIWFLAWKGH